MRSFQSSDGTLWAVDVKVPSFSSAMVFFKHPDGDVARRDRYAWHNSHAVGASDPRSRLRPAEVLTALSDREVAMLFRRSMPVHTVREGYRAS